MFKLMDKEILIILGPEFLFSLGPGLRLHFSHMPLVPKSHKLAHFFLILHIGPVKQKKFSLKLRLSYPSV